MPETLRRRHWLLRTAGLALVAALGAARHGRVLSSQPSRRIAVTATRYSFSPRDIQMPPGEPATLVITATDFAHGFSIPALKLRIDAMPGKAVELALPALPPGRYACLCDNFCGEGHDGMVAVLRVAAGGG